MNKKLLLLFVGCMVTVIATEKIAQESFIVQPKPKKESRNHVNEDIAGLLMGNAKKNARDIQLSAQLQELYIDHGTSLLKQEKNNFFETAEVSQLQEYRTIMRELSCEADRWEKSKQNKLTKLTQLITAPKK